MAPKRSQVPTPSSPAKEFRDFVHSFDPTPALRPLWGADFTEQADTLDAVLTAQFEAGRPFPEAPLENVLLCFCRRWIMAPYLGIDSVEAFLRNPYTLWLLEGIRQQALSDCV